MLLSGPAFARVCSCFLFLLGGTCLMHDQMDIMVITDIERSDIEFISRTLAVKPCAHIDTFTADKLGYVDLTQVQVP